MKYESFVSFKRAWRKACAALRDRLARQYSGWASKISPDTHGSKLDVKRRYRANRLTDRKSGGEW